MGYLRAAEPATLPALDAELPMFAIGRVAVVWGEMLVEVYGVDTSDNAVRLFGVGRGSKLESRAVHPCFRPTTHETRIGLNDCFCSVA